MAAWEGGARHGSLSPKRLFDLRGMEIESPDGMKNARIPTEIRCEDPGGGETACNYTKSYNVLSFSFSFAEW